MLKPTKRKLDGLRLEAYAGLRRQSLHPLLAYLSAVEAGITDGRVLRGESPLVREFRQLIEGPGSDIEFRLQFLPHPDAEKGKRSKSYRQAQQGAETKTAIIMARNGAFERGLFESALKATHAITNLSRATIARHWRRRRDQVAYLMKVGLL